MSTTASNPWWADEERLRLVFQEIFQDANIVVNIAKFHFEKRDLSSNILRILLRKICWSLKPKTNKNICNNFSINAVRICQPRWLLKPQIPEKMTHYYTIRTTHHAHYIQDAITYISSLFTKEETKNVVSAHTVRSDLKISLNLWRDDTRLGTDSDHKVARSNWGAWMAHALDEKKKRAIFCKVAWILQSSVYHRKRTSPQWTSDPWDAGKKSIRGNKTIDEDANIYIILPTQYWCRKMVFRRGIKTKSAQDTSQITFSYYFFCKEEDLFSGASDTKYCTLHNKTRR